MEPAIFERLDGPLRALASAESAGDVLGQLLAAAPGCVPRAALFLVRDGHAVGWGSSGYPDDLTGRQRQASIPLEQGWLGEVAAIGFSLRSATGLGPEPDFGQQESAESVGATIVVEGRPIAIMIGERQPEETWEPRALGWLATVAGLRLELALTRRRLQTGPPERERPVASPAEPAAPKAAPSAAPTAPEPTGLAPAPEPETADPQLEAARRYARLVATDIRLYNEDAVVLGRRHRDLVDRLAEPMGRGKQSFLERHGDLGATAVTLLRDAYVEVLAGGDAELLPDSVFE